MFDREGDRRADRRSCVALLARNASAEAVPSELAMERQVPTQKRRKRRDAVASRQGRGMVHDLCLPPNPIGDVASVTNSLARQAFGAA
jgi:hypothetical protein